MVLLLSANVAGASFLTQFNPFVGKGADEAESTLEEAWQGGGPLVLFADDFTDALRKYYKDIGIEGYYQGVPGTGTGPDRWAPEPLRWGRDGLEGPPGWEHDTDGAGAWRFGTPSEETYPAASLSELVSPVIDLRHAPRVEPAVEVDADTGIPKLVADNTADSPYQTAAPQGSVHHGVYTRRATVALRVLHAYGFAQDGTSLIDGGRVEASFYDAVAGWSSWSPLTPTTDRLMLEDDGMQGSVSPVGLARLDFAADGSPSLDAGVLARNDVTQADGIAVTLMDGNVSQGSADPSPPWVYQGPIEASTDLPGGPWMGFGGDSGGLAESVFDLSMFAGNQVRLRFLARTAASTIGTLTTPGHGWSLERLEVTAVGQQGVDQVVLASPGEGALVPEERDFTPSVALQNRGRAGTTVRVEFDLIRPGGESSKAQATAIVGADSIGRTVVRSPRSFHEMGGGDAGVYELTTRLTVVNNAAGTVTELGTHPMQTFHFGVGQGGGWVAPGLRLVREDATGGERFLFRSETATVEALIQNRETTVQSLVVSGPQAELRPQMLNELGQVVGTMALKGLQNSVDLPVSRELAGSLGTAADLVKVEWTWSGSTTSQPLQLVLVDQDGELVRSGGRYLIEATDPPFVAMDYANRGIPGCPRELEALGQIGVLVCPANVAFTTPATIVDSFVAGEDGETVITLAYNGSVAVMVEEIAEPGADPGEPPGPAADWASLADFDLASDEWAIESVQVPTLAAGWVRLVLTGNGTDSALIDSVSIEVDGVPVLRETFDSDLHAKSLDISPALDATGFHLDGRDNLTRLPDTGVNSTELESTPLSGSYVDAGGGGRYGVSLVFDGERRVSMDGGDAQFVYDPNGGTSGNVLPGGASVLAPTGHLVEKAALAWPEPIALQGVRPALTFRHWMDVKDGGLAAVEASLEGISGPWQRVASLQGRTAGASTVPIHIPLDAFSGRSVHLRLAVYDGASGDLSRTGLGWFIEHVRVSFTGPGGPTELRLGSPTVTGGSEKAGITGPTTSLTFLPDRVQVKFTSKGQCAIQNVREDTYDVGPALVTDPLDLGTAVAPEARIVHSGIFGKHQNPQFNSRTVVDLEYQIKDAQGEWSPWFRASPSNLQGDRLPFDPATGRPGLPIKQGDSYPFLFHPGDETIPRDAIPSASERLETVWDLSSLAGKTVRLQLHAWMEIVPVGNAKSSDPNYCTYPDMSFGFLDWRIASFKVAEERHIANLEAIQVKVTPDDLPRLQGLDPATAYEDLNGTFLDLAGESLLGNDIGQVSVTIKNVGLIAVRAKAQIEVIGPDGVDAEELPTVKPVVDAGAGLPIPRDTTRTFRFQFDASQAPPGRYKLEARSVMLDAVDTDRPNDFRQQPVWITPVRAIGLDATGSSVTPSVASPEASRTIRTTLLNVGNIDEPGLVVHAEVVRLLTMDTYNTTPVYMLPDRSPTLSSVGRRSGQAILQWPIADELATLTLPGERYAVRLHMGDPVARAGVLELDATGNPALPQRELLVPFVVESTLIDSDFGGRFIVSALPGLYPAGGAWSATTEVGGERIVDEALGQWRTVNNTEARALSGGFTSGGGWHLPAYQGAEDVWQNLTSPWLPAHVVQSSSKAILNLRYSSGIDTGQVQVLAQTSDGAEPGPWLPIDGLRMERVAVIIPPDFPQVTGSVFDYSNGQPGHPAPTFGECSEPNDQAVPTQNNRCWWSAFPAPLPAGDPEWRQALNETLSTLAQRHGMENVGLFTTTGEAPILEIADGWLDVQDPVTGLTRSFAVRGLDDLSLSLSTYGALFLLGDGLTTARPDLSPSLERMAQQSGDAAASPPAADDSAILHVEAVSRILRAAASQGVRAIAAIGPASATVAHSGIADGRHLTTWQAENIPATFPAGPGVPPNLRGPDLRSTLAACNKGVVHHPWPACEAPVNFVPYADPDHSSNYHYFSPQDARSLALRDFIQGAEGGRAIFDYDLKVLNSLAPPPLNNACMPKHPFVVQFATCLVPRRMVHDSSGEVALLSAASAADVDLLLDELETVLEATGELPEGTGQWTDLPPTLQYPVGGSFRANETGGEVFIGQPMRVRIAVHSDAFRGGHGNMTLGRVQLLGSPRTADAAIELSEPKDERLFAPGTPFRAQVVLLNRGLTERPVGTPLMAVHQTSDGGVAACQKPDITDFSFAAPADRADLKPGEIRVINVTNLFQGGNFPACPSLPAGNSTAFRFTAQIDLIDDDPENNVARATAIGKLVRSTPIQAVRANPSEAEWSPDRPTFVNVTVRNEGTQSEGVRIELRVRHALASPCSLDNLRTIVACVPGTTQPVPEHAYAPNIDTILQVPRDRSATASLQIPAGALGPGVYAAKVRVLLTDGSDIAFQQSATKTIHLTKETDAYALPATHWQDLAGVTAVPVQDAASGYGPRPPHGLAIGSGGGNDGAYGPDPTTRGRDASGSDQPLMHGWRVAPGGYGETAAGVGDASLLWARSAQGSTPATSTRWVQSQTDTSAETHGDGDFGDDHLVWEPRDSLGPAHPPASLANFDRPSFTFLSEHAGSPYTGYIVEAQVARRTCSVANQQWTCTWSWLGASDWTPLEPTKDASNPLPFERRSTWHLDDSNPSVNRIVRDVPSNPLAGIEGLWGDHSDPAAAEAGAWERLSYVVDPDDATLLAACTALARNVELSVQTSNPCKYGLSQGNRGEDLPRPIRFRLRAASFGGDVGSIGWRIDDLSLTEHSLRFANVASQVMDMEDGASRMMPLRLVNEGAVSDRIVVTPVFQRGAIPDVSARLGNTSATAVHDSLMVDLEPGASRVVWLNVSVGVRTPFQPGTTVQAPLVVVARSIVDATIDARTLVDLSFHRHAYGDLVARGLGIGQDLGAGTASASKGVPASVTVVFRNAGTVPVDAPSGIPVRLVEQLIDPTTAEVLYTRDAVNATGSPAATLVASPLPYTTLRQDSSVTLEWAPQDLGLYRLTALVDMEHLGAETGAFPEMSLDNNQVSRWVAVGPVKLPDLRIDYARLVEFPSGHPVDSVVAGHLYRFDTKVTNHGLGPASNVQVQFQVGGALFSQANEALFPQGPDASLKFQSAIWRASLPGDGSGTVALGVTLNTDSALASVEGGTKLFSVSVSDFSLQAETLAESVVLVPGLATRVPLNITNLGNRVATPQAVAEGRSGSLVASIAPARGLRPNETGRFDLIVNASRSVTVDTVLPTLALTTIEDSLVRVPLSIHLEVGGAGAIHATPMPSRVTPGQSLVGFVLDNPSNANVTWSLESADAIVNATGALQEGLTGPFGRGIASLPVWVRPELPPGKQEAKFVLRADRPGSSVLVPVNATLDILPAASLDVHLVQDHLTSARGLSAPFVAIARNTGNLHILVTVSSQPTAGEAIVPDEPLALAPGQRATIEIDVWPGPSDRALGTLVFAWRALDQGHAAEKTVELPWTAEFSESMLQIMDTDLATGRAVVGELRTVHATLAAAGPAAAVDIILVINGVVEATQTVMVREGSLANATVSYVPRASNQPDELVLLVRPAGSPLFPDDAGFFEVGDAATAAVEVKTAKDGPLGIPAVPGFLFALGLLVAASLRRRRA